MIGKHTEEARRIRFLEQKIEMLKDIIKRKDKEIQEIKEECAEQFKKIYNSLTKNSLGNERTMKRRATEIAKDNFVILTKDVSIENDEKILELPKHDQVLDSSIKNIM